MIDVTDDMVLAGCRVMNPNLFRPGLHSLPNDGPNTKKRMDDVREKVREILEKAIASRNV